MCRLHRNQGSRRVIARQSKRERQWELDREHRERRRDLENRERKTEQRTATGGWSTERRREVCGATILIRRWIYGLNHRRIISDSRALLPPTETYACLFADNCTQLRARPLFLVVSRSLSLSVSLVQFLSPTLRCLSLRSSLQYDVFGSFI